MLPQILEASKSCNISEDKIWIFDVLEQALPEGYKSWKQLLRHGEKEWERFEKEGEKGRTAARLFSSGTTGLPKAAELSHGNLVAEHTLTQEINRKPWKVCLFLLLLVSYLGGADEGSKYDWFVFLCFMLLVYLVCFPFFLIPFPSFLVYLFS